MSVSKEFKDFIIKGNPIDLAVGVLIGGAFGKVVAAVTDGLVKPILGALGGDQNVTLKLGIFDVGIVINAVIGLFITGAVLFFIFVRPMNNYRKAMAAKEPPPHPPGPSQEQLLAEIRDLLKNKS